MHVSWMFEGAKEAILVLFSIRGENPFYSTFLSFEVVFDLSAWTYVPIKSKIGFLILAIIPILAKPG